MTFHLDRIELHVDAAIDEARRLGLRASQRAADHLRERAAAKVPKLSGELEESAEIEVGDEEVAIGYTSQHAVYVHKAPYNFTDGRSGTWLEDAIDESQGELHDIYVDTIRSGWPG